MPTKQGDSVHSVEEPILNIVGDKIALGPMNRDNVPLFQKWHNDFEVVRYFDDKPVPMTLEKAQEIDEREGKNERAIHFTIYEKSSLRPIGWTGLIDISHRHSHAEFGIMIGEKTCWGKGYGTEVATLMLDYGFTCLGLHHIRLRVNSFNEGGIRAYQRAGFRIAGRFREDWRLGPIVCDEILMDCLATEFTSSVLSKLLPELP